MGMRAGGGATHTYRDSKKSVITHPWLLNIPKIIFIPLNIAYEQKTFCYPKKNTDEAMDENYPVQFNIIFFIQVPFSKVNYTICSNIM
jgi:hypothetical protein